jgi:TDG/mug DNA glycosylase family protein
VTDGVAADLEAFSMMADATEPTLPDLLAEGLRVVFVGINPSVFSVTRGHYFARPGNRFWPCFSRSILSAPVREALGVMALQPEHDAALLAHGFGFTDVVKRPTPRASDVHPHEFIAGVADLVGKLERYRPRITCFHGVTGYRHVHHAFETATVRHVLGPQSLRIGATTLYLVPSPSAANAHFTPADQTQWYDRLAHEVTGSGTVTVT